MVNTLQSLTKYPKTRHQVVFLSGPQVGHSAALLHQQRQTSPLFRFEVRISKGWEPTTSIPIVRSTEVSVQRFILSELDSDTPSSMKHHGWVCFLAGVWQTRDLELSAASALGGLREVFS